LQQLQSLVEDRLSGAEEAPLAAHVETCCHCQELLEQLTSAFPLSTLDPRRPSSPDPEAVPNEEFVQRLRQTPPVARRFLETDRWPAVPGYEIVGELGRGGMGVVYRARQIGLGRLVALKMLLDGPHASPDRVARLRREAEAVARLRHPNIVQIYEIGEQDGRPFFSLELVEGGSLEDRLDGAPQNPRAAAELVRTLAGAVQAAHEKGIVHRDLKPANILLQEEEKSLTQSRKGRQGRQGAGRRKAGPGPALFGLLFLCGFAALRGVFFCFFPDAQDNRLRAGQGRDRPARRG
jgi:serine/threonine protein kinase